MYFHTIYRDSDYDAKIAIASKDEKVFNQDFYVNLDEIEVDDFIKVINHNKYANKIPTTNSIINRFTTMFCFSVYNMENIFEKYTKYLSKYDKNDKINYWIKDIILSLMDDMNEIDMKDKILYIEFFTDMVNSTYIALHDKNISYPLFSVSSLAETIEKEDVRISFSEKATGIISAAFNIRPFTIDGIYFEAIPGSFMKMDKESLKMSFIGTEFTKEKFEDLSNLKVSFDISFIPANAKQSIYSNKEEFEKFGKFVKYAGAKSDENPLVSFPYALQEIKITCEGTNVDSFGGADKIGNDIIEMLKLHTTDFSSVTSKKTDKNETIITFDTNVNIENDNVYLLEPILN